jgi:hypothetical protein
MLNASEKNVEGRSFVTISNVVVEERIVAYRN